MGDCKKAKNNDNGAVRVHLTTLGCSKNEYDSEILLGQLKANEVDIVKQPEQANVIILNTCGFITPAKEESIQAILEANQIKAQQPDTKVLVCGCLSQRYQADLRRDIPEVDAYFGTEDFVNILQYLNLEPKSPGHLYTERYRTRQPHFAYLKISEGCNHKCAFCAIPLMRGRHRSRPFSDIIAEARSLAEQGVKEVILIAQDTTFYGIDLYKKQRIVELLSELEKIDGIEWIRLHYAYPTTFPEALVEVMARSEKIVHYLDLPIQHISDSVLKAMKRGGTARRIRTILEDVRSYIPDVVLRTTLIAGHPGETEEDFNILVEFIREMRFDRLGVFVYSPEENTAGFHLPHPSEEIAKQRRDIIMNIQQKISLEINREKIGKQYRVLIDEYDSRSLIATGRTYADSPEIDNEVIVGNIKNSAKPGSFYNVRIEDATEYEIFGTILEG